jgi:uncharacterized protein YbjT (DUF2867 family)
MQEIITGASGHVGSAVIPELLEAGPEVVGLARSDASSAALEALGAKVHPPSPGDKRCCVNRSTPHHKELL